MSYMPTMNRVITLLTICCYGLPLWALYAFAGTLLSVPTNYSCREQAEYKQKIEQTPYLVEAELIPSSFDLVEATSNLWSLHGDLRSKSQAES